MAERDSPPLWDLLGSNKSLAAILLLVGASLFPTWLVGRSRPDVPELPYDPVRESHSGQSLRARLWQDPLETVYEATERDDGEGEVGPEERQEHRESAYGLLAKDGANDVLVMPVVVNGGSTPNERENRLRYRYAVVSALGVAGYVPEDSRRIGYFESELTFRTPELETEIEGEGVAEDDVHTPCNPAPVPYELFVERLHDDPSAAPKLWSRIAVLWIDSDVLRTKPAETLFTIPHGLLAGHGERSWNVDLRILFTTSSTSLIAFLEDWERLAAAHDSGDLSASELALFLEGLCPQSDGSDSNPAWWLLATAATVPDRVVMQHLSLEREPAPVCVEAPNPETGRQPSDEHPWERSSYVLSLGATHGRLVRTIGDDELLVESLYDELRMRCGRPERVAIFSEWDTDYGRAWEDSFRAVFDQDEEVEIDHYSYLAGIDGRIPGDTGEAAPTQNGASDPEPYDANGTERSDYIRRLIDRLASLSTRAEGDDAGSLDAIGVLGSDVHDKLFLLSVLRREFPGAVFFTTDLDARFLDPSRYDYLRNLVVVSHYGLDLQPELQGDLPPFRNGYQAGLFHATLSALGHGNARAHGPTTPRVYEVGKHGFFDLSPRWVPAEGATHDVEPTRPFVSDPVLALVEGHNLLFLGLGLVCGLVLICLIFCGATAGIDLSPTLSAQLKRSGLVLFLFLGALWAVYFHQAGSDSREPFALFEGVSAWPTEILRIVACSLAIGWQYRVMRDMQDRVPRVESDLGIVSSTGEPCRAEEPAATPAHYDGHLRERVIVPAPPVPETAAVPVASKASASPAAAPARAALGPYRPRRAPSTTDFRIGSVRLPQEARQRAQANLLQVQAPRRPHVLARWWKRLRPRDGAEGEARGVVAIFDEFAERSERKRRLRRAFLYLLVFLVMTFCIMRALGRPTKPIRGEWARGFDMAVIIGSVLSMQWLMFVVLDVGMTTSRFIQSMVRYRVVNPERMCYRTAREKVLKDELVWAKRRIEATASLTDDVGKFLYYPSIVIALMVLSRLPVFDAWVWSRSLVIVVGLTIVILVVCYVLLWASARRLRRQVLQSLLRERGETFGDEPTRKAVDEYIEDVRRLRKGAFAPIWDHPLLRAILIPFAGLGSASMLQLL